jgi:hypothetical protein
LVWFGAAVEVAVVPSPPPNWPTIVRDVGALLPFVKDRLFVRLIVRSWPVGTVITTGDQLAGTAGVVEVAGIAAAFGFERAQVAVEPVTAVPQL